MKHEELLRLIDKGVKLGIARALRQHKKEGVDVSYAQIKPHEYSYLKTQPAKKRAK